MRAIVLSGGGARGSYQIGVWKALRKLHIQYDIVTGSSVGSINGALMTQKAFYRALWFWRNLNFNRVFSNPIDGDYQTSKGKRELIKKYAKEIILNSGLDASELEKNIISFIDEEKIRRSKINFGIVTVNLSNLKAVKIVKREIPKGKLKDYLMASSAPFPVFQKKKIDDENYIDGGYYDNLPINLAISMGAKEIIAVDLRVAGIKRPIKNKNIKITYIAPRNHLGSFFAFHADAARRGIRLGYNDAMKTFNKLDGNKYTFKRNHLSRNYKHYGDYYNQLLDVILKYNNNILMQPIKNIIFKREHQTNDLVNVIEHLGKVFRIDDSFIYNIKKYNKVLLSKMDELPIIDRKTIESSIKKEGIKSINNKHIIKYMYDKLESRQFKELSHMALVLPRDLLDAIYLYTIKHY